MKIIRAIYFHIYNAYYKDGSYSNDIPHLTALGIVGSSFGMLSVSVLNLLKFLLTGYKFFPREFALIMILVLILSFFLFLSDNKYKKIYIEMKGSSFDGTFIKVFAWSIVFIGFISFFVTAYSFKNIESGW